MNSSNEWYTPSKYIEAARKVMGSIDLDPASCALANQTVKATRYYTKEDNGLSKEWHGNIWLNPPYGKLYKDTGTTAFVSKLIEGYVKGDVEQAIVLTMMGMYANWFFRLLQYPVCFLKEKPIFYLPDGTNGKLGFAACCTYIGTNEQKFVDTFSKFGRIVRAIDIPEEKPFNLDLWESAS